MFRGLGLDTNKTVLRMCYLTILKSNLRLGKTPCFRCPVRTLDLVQPALPKTTAHGLKYKIGHQNPWDLESFPTNPTRIANILGGWFTSIARPPVSTGIGKSEENLQRDLHFQMCFASSSFGWVCFKWVKHRCLVWHLYLELKKNRKNRTFTENHPMRSRVAVQVRG